MRPAIYLEYLREKQHNSADDMTGIYVTLVDIANLEDLQEITSSYVWETVDANNNPVLFGHKRPHIDYFKGLVEKYQQLMLKLVPTAGNMVEVTEQQHYTYRIFEILMERQRKLLESVKMKESLNDGLTLIALDIALIEDPEESLKLLEVLQQHYHLDINKEPAKGCIRKLKISKSLR
ncbi:hypothetical protein D770_04740 [Flammeovirgaceae bacterium 311]|nr:hypothetical protein D770_04740 [Flammeovirgaceae bacterium 311]